MSMKKLVLLILVAQVYLFWLLQADYIPSKNEWLRLRVEHDVQQLMSYWEKRYTANVIIYNDKKVCSIGIDVANGEAPLTDREAEQIIPTIKSRAEAVLDSYWWAQKYEIVVVVTDAPRGIKTSEN